MTIPFGVTVQPAGAPRAAFNRPRNLIERAALADDRDEARDIICKALGIDPASPLARIHLSDDYRWSRVSPPSRLMEIGEWLKAEAYECMDLVECPSISTLGD